MYSLNEGYDAVHSTQEKVDRNEARLMRRVLLPLTLALFVGVYGYILYTRGLGGIRF